MKKIKLICLYLVISSFFWSFTNAKENDLLKAKIKGPVKVIEEFRYSTVVKFGKKHKYTLVDKCISRYDKNGNLTESLYDHSNDLFDVRDTYEYDLNGKLLEHKRFNLDDKIMSRIVYTYNEKNQVKELNIYDSQNKIYQKETYDYDVKGNNIRKEILYGYKTKRIYQYDDNSNLIKINIYDSIDNFIREEIFRYNNKGELIESNINSIGSYTMKTNYKYDDKSNLIEENNFISDSIGILSGNMRYTINGYKYKSYNSKGKLNTKSENKEIEFDEYSNWTKMKTIQINSSQKTIELSERKIEYY